MCVNQRLRICIKSASNSRTRIISRILENFFNAVRGKGKLNCPAEVGYESAVSVLKVNEAVEAGCKLEFKPEEFKV